MGQTNEDLAALEEVKADLEDRIKGRQAWIERLGRDIEANNAEREIHKLALIRLNIHLRSVEAARRALKERSNLLASERTASQVMPEDIAPHG